MYRCPEQLDMYSNFPIGPKCDIWALGCILYYICYQKHPFEDSAKLRIVNANYTFPHADARYQCFHDIIKGCLQIDPRNRFDVNHIQDRLGAISDTKGWPLKGPIKLKVRIICLYPQFKLCTSEMIFTTFQLYSIFHRANRLRHRQMSHQQ